MRLTRLLRQRRKTPWELNPDPNVAVASLQGQLWDLTRPLPEGVGEEEVEYHGFDSPIGQSTLRHSAAHLLGAALRQHLGADLDDGPATPTGFFYDARLPDDAPVRADDLKRLAKAARKLANQARPFERREVSREEAHALFRDSPLKLALLERLEPPITVYQCGDFVDLCRGPHVRHTGLIKALDVTACSATADQHLQRVHGVAFRSKEELTEHQARVAEAERRDHRRIGRDQGLFLFHDVAPGSAFLLPHGMRVVNALTDWIRDEYRARGFEEVVTPQIFKRELWETSGHMEHYAEDMYKVTPYHSDDDNDSQDEFGLKPMNCPGHCVMFRHAQRWSHRDLPVRLAEFSPLHRNELSGALSGLTRVRRFCQDDAHIFCRPDQIEAEMAACLDFVGAAYARLGMDYRLRLSTRPDGSAGAAGDWEAAEAQLRAALDGHGHPWELNPGDGAFYGPKIDVAVLDALGREHQCATIQLDFHLPSKFELAFDGADGQRHTPVVIHRAVLGSVERMLAILIEHTAGKWPLWLSPRQAAVLPVAPHDARLREYAEQVRDAAPFKYVDVHAHDGRLAKRVRDAQIKGYNYQLVVGDAELERGTVRVRSRDENKDLGEMRVEELGSLV